MHLYSTLAKLHQRIRIRFKTWENFQNKILFSALDIKRIENNAQEIPRIIRYETKTSKQSKILLFNGQRANCNENKLSTAYYQFEFL